MLLCAITSRTLLAEDEAERAQKLIALVTGWAAGGVDFIQIREKDLSARDLTRLAAKMVRAVRENGATTKVIINSGPETGLGIAIESRADGVHLPGGLNSDRLAAAISHIRKTWLADRIAAPPPMISVACHAVADVRTARAAGATLALFAPVFEKFLWSEMSLPTAASPAVRTIAGQGLEALAQACQAGCEPSHYPALPVLALGGVTRRNARQCLAAGAAGIAAIRLFLDADFPLQAL